MFTKKHLAASITALLAAGSVSAGQITGWSDVNVLTTVDSVGAGASIIYDRALPDVNTPNSGRIIFDGTEAVAPGLKVVNDAAAGDPNDAPGGGDVFNCIMASSDASCNSPRQSGKRFKLDRTGPGAIDLVFDTDPDGTFTTEGNDGLYKVFQNFRNATDGQLPDFTVSLGTGVGAEFQSSTDGDGLSFVDFGADPRNSEFSSFFSRGLFGASDGDRFLLDGYFDVNRAGYGLQLISEDVFASTGMFGAYSTLFGDLLPFAHVPNGFFYDDDGDADTENVLLAHQLADGSWVQNRSLDSNGVVSTIGSGNDGTTYLTLEALLAALQASSGLSVCGEDPDGPCLAGVDIIEDLAKFNLTYSIDPTGFEGEEFSLRFTSVSTVPEPGSIALLALGLGAIGFTRRRRAH